MKELIMFMATAVLMSQTAVAQVSGTANLRSSGMRFDFGYDLQKAGDTVSGQVFNQGYNQVSLRQTQRGWTGRFGDMVISRARITKQNNRKTEIEIAALPQGFYSFTVTQNKKGNISISGMGPRGELNRGTLKADGSEITADSGVAGSSINLRRDARRGGRFEGSFIAFDRFGRMQNGFATLRVQGDLDPAAVFNQDPVLYTILYVLPFSR